MFLFPTNVLAKLISKQPISDIREEVNATCMDGKIRYVVHMRYTDAGTSITPT